ncbi:LytR/AlgR family response regulator transcription factor [Desulfotomaculum sp. 1211_IL3151]|uniref:LytR/AlgR family response regulator transcription factor n=1 Tax=Desulfotomaculum sp. 1211_IL3151 TaxID=3084055 RepID=UPI002FD99ADA
MVNINAIVVEDDRYFSKMFVKMLQKTNKINVLAIYNSSEQFISNIKYTIKPEVVFLDIELPGLLGSELGKEIRKKYQNIQVVFVTGKVDFAPEAFDIEAADYLVKPFDYERLNRCIARVYERIGYKKKTYLLKTKTTQFNLDIGKILFVEKVDKNIVFHTPEGIFTGTDTIEAAYLILEEEGFIRSHRSYIINPSYIKSIERWADRSYQIKFSYGEGTAFLSRTYLNNFKAKLQAK